MDCNQQLCKLSEDHYLTVGRGIDADVYLLVAFWDILSSSLIVSSLRTEHGLYLGAFLSS